MPRPDVTIRPDGAGGERCDPLQPRHAADELLRHLMRKRHHDFRLPAAQQCLVLGFHRMEDMA